MRVLMVGTGSIGRRHMASLRSFVPNVQFDVLRENGRSRDTSELGDVEVVGSLDEGLARKPHMMVIANPSSMHLRSLLAAIDAGIPFYAEKPVVSSLDDLSMLQGRVASGGLPPNLVGCNLRFLPSLIAFKALIDGGRLGNIVRADFEAGQWLPNWRPSQDYRLGYSANRSQGGGVLLDLIHEVDAALWLLDDFEHVTGYATHASALEIDTDDCAGILMARAGGPITTVRIDYVSRKPVRRYTLVGDRGTATWDLRASTIVLEDEAGSQEIQLPAGAFDVSTTYLSAMQELLAAIKANRPSTQPLEEGLRALTTVLRAKRIYS
jgi:predicted dehydrogenase